MYLFAGTAILAALSLLVIVSLIWRWASTRQALPCPSQFSWMLENPLMNQMAGATRLFDFLDLRPGMTLLDVGCGPGRMTVPGALRVGTEGRVLALDMQEAMIRKAQNRAQQAGLTNIEFILKGMGEGALPAACCDRAILVTVLGEIPDRAAALRGIHTALRPGGRLCIAEILLDPHYQPRARVEALARETGFTLGPYQGGWISYTQILEKPE
ncbi:MAG: class I SAM-dependent methyltransferase [Candidatus Hydrogenedentes bacterium]|nr:class I SAM-dependent methyltransferase [Candidatus Hydrogenedentota bacterium]